uniref:CCHC-type domain-containing protein n=1 Tax=Meloidogyne incognita TaxID=6306 RepID=A0A914N3N6_MELIC
MPLEEEIIELESSIEDLDNLIRGLCAAKDEINSVFDDWAELNKKATSAERPEFDASFKAFELKHRPSQYAAEAEKKLTSLRMSKSKLSRKLRLKKLNLRRENAQIEQAPKVAPATPVHFEVRHEALSIGKFYGTDPDLWPDWWELFMSIHEDSGLSTERKFLYLRSFIPQESPAGLLIDGFQPSEYVQAIDLLKQNYENKDRRIRNLQQQLLTLPNCNTLEDVRKFYLNLERICRQLAGLGNDTDSDLYYSLLETKLTRPMLREILAVKKEAGDSWTTGKFRLELKRLLESEMEILSILKKMGDEKKGEEKKQFSKPKDEHHTPKRTGNEKRMSPREEDDSPPPTVACPTVGKTNRKETVRENKEKRSLYCYFCQKKHWSNECRKYSTLQARKERIKKEKRCIRCCRFGHEAADCQHPSKCLGCSRAHPLALCPNQKIPQQPKFKQSAGVVKQNGFKKKWTQEKIKQSADDRKQSHYQKKWTPNQWTPKKWKMDSIRATAPETQSRGFKYCLLKCVQAKMFNPTFGRNKKVSGTIFIDSGSQSSMISERLAKKLMLKPHSFEKLELRGVGPRDLATSSYSKMVKVGLETSKGPMNLELLVVPSEHLPPMVTVQIGDQDKTILETNPLEAKHKIENPDVLIGAKYLNELEIAKIRQLPSGFWLSKSILGPLLDSEGELIASAIVSQLPELNCLCPKIEARNNCLHIRKVKVKRSHGKAIQKSNKEWIVAQKQGATKNNWLNLRPCGGSVVPLADEDAPQSFKRKGRIKKYNEGTARKENAESEKIGKQAHQQLYPPEIKKGREKPNNIGRQQVRQKAYTGLSGKERSTQRLKQLTPQIAQERKLNFDCAKVRKEIKYRKEKLRIGKAKSPGPHHSRGVRLENSSICENDRGEGKIQPQIKKRKYLNIKSPLIKVELIGKREKLYCLKKKATTNYRKNSGAKRCIRKKDIPTDFETRTRFLAVLGILLLATLGVLAVPTRDVARISVGEAWAWVFSFLSILFLLSKEVNSLSMATVTTAGSFRTTRAPNHILASTFRGRMESNRGGSSALRLCQPDLLTEEEKKKWKTRVDGRIVGAAGSVLN